MIARKNYSTFIFECVVTKRCVLTFECTASYYITTRKIQSKNGGIHHGKLRKTNIGNEGRVELHDTLSLTGAEISINDLPAGANVPFVHSHKNNEEVYGILSGKGKVIIDGEEIALTAGDWVRIAPVAKRQFFAAEDEGISFVCIQTKENSLEGFTADDAVVY